MKVDVRYDINHDEIVVTVALEDGHHHTEYVPLTDVLGKPPLYVQTHSAEPYKHTEKEKINIAPGCDTVTKLNTMLFHYTGTKVDVFLSPKDWEMVLEELLCHNQLFGSYDAYGRQGFFMFMGKAVYPRGVATYYPTDVGDAGIEKATAEPKTDADKAIDDAIERSKPVEKPLSWEERLKKELNEGVDTWGRIEKKHKR